jgi:ubiquinone/menaquinone biosynthesis C-methylase UbiE
VRLDELALAQLGDIEGKRVLEAGCGDGGFCRLLCEREAEVDGIDLSSVAIEQAIGSCPRARFEVGSVTSLPYRDESFDLVVCLETLEHVPDWRRGLEELIRVLRPGGRFIITTPNYLGPMGLYRLWLWVKGERYTEMGQPVNNVTTTLGRWWQLRRRGLEILAVDGRRVVMPLPGGRFWYLDGLERFRWICQHGCIAARKT